MTMVLFETPYLLHFSSLKYIFKHYKISPVAFWLLFKSQKIPYSRVLQLLLRFCSLRTNFSVSFCVLGRSKITSSVCLARSSILWKIILMFVSIIGFHKSLRRKAWWGKYWRVAFRLLSNKLTKLNKIVAYHIVYFPKNYFLTLTLFGLPSFTHLFATLYHTCSLNTAHISDKINIIT